MDKEVKYLRLQQIIIQPVLVWDTGEELIPLEQQLKPVSCTMAQAREFLENMQDSISDLETRLNNQKG